MCLTKVFIERPTYCDWFYYKPETVPTAQVIYNIQNAMRDARVWTTHEYVPGVRDIEGCKIYP